MWIFQCSSSQQVRLGLLDPYEHAYGTSAAIIDSDILFVRLTVTKSTV